MRISLTHRTHIGESLAKSLKGANMNLTTFESAAARNVSVSLKASHSSICTGHMKLKAWHWICRQF